jgi:hypothetical protein
VNGLKACQHHFQEPLDILSACSTQVKTQLHENLLRFEGKYSIPKTHFNF